MMTDAATNPAPPAATSPKYIEVLTLFPQLFESFVTHGILQRALAQDLLQLKVTPLREFGRGRWKSVDDSPYGGGAGMVLRADVLAAALNAISQRHAVHQRRLRRVLLTPQGKTFDQATAHAYAHSEEVLVLICGRYEGFDERVRTQLVDEELSLGDFICQGGEVPALAVLESLTRLLPGVLGNPASTIEESFSDGLLEYPQYTRPEKFEGESVPSVLLSGDHQRIHQWRKQQAQQRTARRRPDLLQPAKAPSPKK